MILNSSLGIMLCLFMAISMVGCDGDPSSEDDRSQALPSELIEANNRGVGLMGSFDYDGAWILFRDLVDRYPEHAQLRINLAIAQLNRQSPEDEQEAMEILDDVVKEDPSNLRALYVSAILSGYMGDIDKSNIRFQIVSEADPVDAFAAYYTGQGFAQTGRPEEALRWFRRSMELDPYLRSAIYGAAQTSRRLGLEEEAEQYLEEFQALADNPRGHLAEIKYTRMGTKAEVKVLGSPSPAAPVDLDKIWSPAEVLSAPGYLTVPIGASMSACDIDLDGTVDIFCSGIKVDEGWGEGDWSEVSSFIGWNRPAQGWTLEVTSPLAGVSDVQSSLWGDVDGNGWPDVFLCRQGMNQLWLQDDGQWKRDETIESAQDSPLNTVDGAMFDADHDGDLDIYVVNGNGANVLLNNNRDGSWRRIGPEDGMPSTGSGSTQVLVTDIDRDRDLDLIVLNKNASNDVFINDRLWRYRQGNGFDELRSHSIASIVASDQDADGKPELMSRDFDGSIRRWVPDAQGQWKSTVLVQPEREESVVEPRPVLGLLDVTGSGESSLIYAIENGLSAGEQTLRVDDLLTWMPVNLHAGKGPSLMMLQSDDDGRITLMEIPPGPGRYPFVSVSFTGQEDPGQSMRSNASGIGTQYAARRGSNWSVGRVLRDDSGPGQSLQPVAVGLGADDRLDFIAIEWSDGVYQTELGLAEDTVIRETQRQLSSCPVLFMRDGEEYVFISDVLGVGGIGFRTGRDTVVSPRPWERFLIPDIEMNEDSFDFILAEPMEESCYLDSVQLVQWQLPPGWSMTLDERMGTGIPKPTGVPVFYRRSLAASSATTLDGSDVLDDLASADRRAVDPGPVDSRFLGRLGTPQVLTLKFDSPLQELPGRPVLVMDGWVEYPYSQTCFAAWQAGAAYEPPSIEALGADGQWRMVLDGVGYPAGMPRQMSVPLDDLPDGCIGLRISTNLDLYWDAIKVVGSEQCPGAWRQVLSMTGADLMHAGFPARTNSDQKYPDFDWSARTPLWDTRYQKGFYTRYGDIEQLVQKKDSALAIFGTGEAVNIRFQRPDSSLSPGWSSRFVLEIEGWCKDKDMFTVGGDTIEPLPVRAVGEAGLLHDSLNDRWMGGR